MRIAGWLAVTGGLAATTAAILGDDLIMDMLGGYGLLFVLSGSWVLIGHRLLAYRERMVTERQVAARASRTGPAS